MAIAVIKRLGFKEDSGAFQAKALKALAGKENVKVTLRGRWRTLQGNTVVETPCFATVWDNGDIDIGTPGFSSAVRAEPGGTMDIVARVERVLEHG